jgi:predicted acetyltransferase
MKYMKVRKLRQEEHIRTRKLWEEIFTEDTPEFLDYYYSVKTSDNEIYVMEDDGEIVSMLHLNPYQMRVRDKIYQTHYIVAVATDERYRHQGLMRQLLNHAMQIMADRGELFTFLMPAAEAIYKPFGFEFVYEQKREKVSGKKCKDSTLEIFEASPELCQAIADFANEMLKNYDVVTWRDADYYKMILAEQVSENGGILVAKRDGKIEGVFCYAKEADFEIREPLYYDKAVLRHAIYHLTGNETDRVLCTGYGSEESKPIIMAKVLNPEFDFDLKNAKVFLNEVV